MTILRPQMHGRLSLAPYCNVQNRKFHFDSRTSNLSGSPYGKNYNLLFAGAVLSVIPVMIIFFACQKLIYGGYDRGWHQRMICINNKGDNLWKKDFICSGLSKS